MKAAPKQQKPSVLAFNDIHFSVGKGKKKKQILSNINGKIEAGHVLALLGPSGAGKSTFIHALSRDATYGKTTGSVTLNGKRLTMNSLKNNCFVVKQHDSHWEYLTARQNLMYAAELYHASGSGGNTTGSNNKSRKEIVDNLIDTMGLSSCAKTAAGKLSGGQRRRLSLAIGIIKKPQILFLDEPTSGLDAASATAIMQEIIRVARDESLIILCTIHQPSTKVYQGFDQVMILSQGRQAYFGDAAGAAPYFASIGHPVPMTTNPAEHFLDLVNADFSSSKEVVSILDQWDEQTEPLLAGKTPNIKRIDDTHSTSDTSSMSSYNNESNNNTKSFAREISIMTRRHANLVLRDPILYLGRAIILLLTNSFFAFVYWNGRYYLQEQAMSKTWVTIWFVGVPSNMAVVAVYSLNEEFKSIQREVKNGMMSVWSYIIVKTFLVIPIFFGFAVAALGVPAFVIALYPITTFLKVITMWSVLIYFCECVAEFLAALVDSPIIGMLCYLAFWFCSFLFNGFLISRDDLFVPFNLFFYILPQGFYLRSMLYLIFVNGDWEPCDPAVTTTSAICLDTTDGLTVLGGLKKIFPVIELQDYYYTDLAVLVGLSFMWKALGIVVMVFKTRKISTIHEITSISKSSTKALAATGTRKEEPTTATIPNGNSHYYLEEKKNNSAGHHQKKKNYNTNKAPRKLQQYELTVPKELISSDEFDDAASC